MTQLKKNDGYVSIETILVAGLIIVLGIVLILKFSSSTQKVTEGSQKNIETISNAQNEQAKELINSINKAPEEGQGGS